MLPAMIRRVPPLAAALALVAAGLVATVWSTRGAIGYAYEAVRYVQAFTVQQAVRGDLADLGAMPTPEELVAIVHEHDGDGLRYVGIVDGRGRVEVQAGDAIGRP